MIDPKTGIDPDVYRNAKSPRPGWANVLIFAAIALLVGIVLTVASGIAAGVWFFGATLVLLVIAGVAALTTIKRPPVA